MKKRKSILAGIIVTVLLVMQVMQGAIVNVQSGVSANASAGETIRPFHVNIPEKKLADLKRRIIATQWPEQENVKDATQGVQLATMQALAKYRATSYNWRKVEARLNAV